MPINKINYNGVEHKIQDAEIQEYFKWSDWITISMATGINVMYRYNGFQIEWSIETNGTTHSTTVQVVDAVPENLRADINYQVTLSGSNINFFKVHSTGKIELRNDDGWACGSMTYSYL